MSRAMDYATPARSEDTHGHVCKACRQPWSCPDPDCVRPAEAMCQGCVHCGVHDAVALSLARSGWAALRAAQTCEDVEKER